MSKFEFLLKYIAEQKEIKDISRELDLLYHRVKITLSGCADKGAGIITITSLIDPILTGYVSYDMYEEAKMVFDHLTELSKVVDYMWRHIRITPSAYQFNEILGDEFRQNSIYGDNDKINIILPQGR